jgi:pilus assembly protein CpaC
MTTEIPGRRRAPLCAALPIAGIAAALCLFAGAALALETAPHAIHQLVPSGAGGTIELAPASTAEETVSALSLEKGKSVIVHTAYTVTRVSVGDPAIADVIVLHPQEIQIVGKSIGSTNVVLWGGAQGIQAAIDLAVGSAYSSIEAAIQRVAGVSGVHVDTAGNAVVVSGAVPDAASVERVISVARAHFPDKESGEIINLLTVGGNQQVMIEVTVSEIDRDKNRDIAANWIAERFPRTANGTQGFVMNRVGALTKPIFDDTTGALKEIEFSDTINLLGFAFPIGRAGYELFVDALDENGLGKILATPTLIARTGETAKFLSGGEVPIPVASSLDRITVTYKEFGVGVAFTPTVLSDDRIHLDVTTEVSQVDFGLGTAVSGTTAPGFRTRRASTGVDIGDGQTFAIAGLLREELTEKVNMYPLLGEIPILGAFFRSSNFEKHSTELVMLVRPRLVKPLDPEAPPLLPTDYFDEPNAFEFYLLGRAEGFDNRVAATEPQAGFVGDAGYRLPATPEEDRNEQEAK